MADEHWVLSKGGGLGLVDLVGRQPQTLKRYRSYSRQLTSKVLGGFHPSLASEEIQPSIPNDLLQSDIKGEKRHSEHSRYQDGRQKWLR